MHPENPENPPSDELPEDERTGDEPNPSGKPPVDALLACRLFR